VKKFSTKWQRVLNVYDLIMYFVMATVGVYRISHCNVFWKHRDDSLDYVFVIE
jgi:hypothetical protein